MIKHLFKLIWNRKKSNFLMMIGIFISFLALYLVTTTINYNIGNYLKPLGFSYKNVWVLSMDWKDKSSSEIKETLTQMEYAIRSFPEVETFAYSECYIFAQLVTSQLSYKYNDRTISTTYLKASDHLADLLDIEIVEGRWFNESDNAATRNPIVINKYTRDELFLNESAVGKIITDRDGEDEYIVIGVIAEFRNSGEFTGSKRIVFERLSLDNETGLDLLTQGESFTRILMKVKPGTECNRKRD